jgi:septal ring factor EnvC (AmiA/AmiB activator)
MFGSFNLIQFAVIVTLIGVGYGYFKISQNTIDNLNTENAKLASDIVTLTNSVNEQNNTINSMQQAINKQIEENVRLRRSLTQSEVTRRDLEIKLKNDNLEFNARQNKRAIEEKINKDTQTQFKNIEEITGLEKKSETDNNIQPPPAPPKKW